MPLSENDIKCELSYAWLHAISAAAGCSCRKSDRVGDNLGIDADLTATGDFGPGALSRFGIDVQLKATTTPLVARKGRLAFDIEVGLYNRMRVTTVVDAWLLVVLELPADMARWVGCSEKALALRGRAYWVSLRNAPPTTNRSEQRVYLPTRNRFTVEALSALLPRFARREMVTYETA